MEAQNATDIVLLSAPQAVADAILGPCAIGWCLQLVFGGMATGLAGSLLLTKKARVGQLSAPLLLAATVFNLAAMAVNAAEIWQYMLSQQRSSTDLNGYTAADCIAPLFEGLTVAVCQTFMGIRCVRIAGRSMILCLIIGCGIAASLAGAVWLTVGNFMYRSGRVGPGGLLIPTELWLWAQVATDVALTAVLSYSLRKMKKGFNKSTDQFISSLIYLAFGTCAIPLLFTVFTATVYAATYRLETLWNLFNATAPAVPALYVISFCYCLRASVSKHAKLDQSSFTPGSAFQTLSVSDQWRQYESGIMTNEKQYRPVSQIKVNLPRPARRTSKSSFMEKDNDEPEQHQAVQMPREAHHSSRSTYMPRAEYTANSREHEPELFSREVDGSYGTGAQPSDLRRSMENETSHERQNSFTDHSRLSGVFVTVDTQTISQD